MTTEARRRERTMEARTTILFVGVLLALMVVGFIHIDTITKNLKKQQAESCLLRRAGRADTNAHDRLPLKASLTYLGNAILAGAQHQTGAQRAKTAAFGNQLLLYASQIKPLVNPRC